MTSEHEVPRLGITICVEPPSDNKDPEPVSGGSIDWPLGRYSLNDQQSFSPGYPQAYPQPSRPQDIPRIHPPYEDPNNSPNAIWEARSPASSDSGWSNPSSPLQEHFNNEEFHDDGSEFLLDNRSYVSDIHYQEEFDIESFLNLGTSDAIQSPDTDFFSGPDPYQPSPPLPLSNPNPSPNSFPPQSLQYAPPYNSGQGSPTFGLGFPNGFQNTGNNTNAVSSMRPNTHHRSSSDFLSPPLMNRSGRSYSRGPGGHRSTISEGSSAFMAAEHNPEASLFLDDDLRGRGLARAKSAPSSKAIFRGKSPYDRPATQTGIPRLEIPIFNGSFSGQSTPELESPSPSSAKDVVATDAMIQASIKRRKRDANFFCLLCNASFTTENSKRRHESSHSGEKPFKCTKDGCDQTFSNADDRKRHETKSKKHAQ